MLPYSNTLFDGSQPEDSTRPRYVGSLTAKHDPAVKAALAGSDGGSISSSSSWTLLAAQLHGLPCCAFAPSPR